MVKSWSISRLEAYNRCPRKFKYEQLQKLCPACFNGKLRGEFGASLFCDSCGEESPVPAPLKRGSEIGESLELYVNGTTSDLHREIKHPKVIEIANDLRTKFEAGKVKTEHQMAFTREWEPCEYDDWDRAWLRVKLDVQVSADGNAVEIVDWKTGGIDKKTGGVKADAKYDDQLNLYAVAVLSRYPSVERTNARLVFVDCGARFDCIVERPSGSLTRADLAKAQVRWTKKAKALLSDKLFAPSPSPLCNYCPFSVKKEGPCQF